MKWLFGFTVASALVLSAPGIVCAQNWFTIKGQIVFAGDKIPEATPLKVDKDQDHCLAKGPILSEEWVVNPQNKGVRWAFVWLDAGKGKKMPIHPSLQELPQKEVVIDQPQCAFVPHALGMRQGQILVAKNSSPIAHNTNIQGHPLKNPGKNVIVPAGQQVLFENFVADTFPLTVSCNIHPWMTAKIRVYDHPYFAVTDADGKFELKLAPEGEYYLVVWHEGSGWGPGGRSGTRIVLDGDKDVGKLEIKPAN